MSSGHGALDTAVAQGRATAVISRALVAAAVATLLQLRRTLRSAEAFLEALSPRLDRTLEVAGRAVAMAVRALGIGRRSAPAGQPEPGEPDA